MTKIRVEIEGRRIRVGDECRDLLSGEVHYWRLDPDNWDAVLDRVREMGLDIISTYVPWHYHELSPGRHDFTGRTARCRNLAGWLERAHARGLWVIARPGPYLYTEWVNRGVPDDVAGYHRAHPEFRRRAEPWIHAVCDALRPFLASRGGPVVMVQAENEIDLWSRYYEDQMGFLDRPGLFQEYLRSKYGRIAALNRAWRARLKSFAAARPVTQDLIADAGFRRRWLDFCEFQLMHSVEVGAWAVDCYRREKLGVPLYMNGYPCFHVQHGRELERLAGLYGADLYPTREFSGSANERRHYVESVLHLRSFSKLPYIAEFEAGVWQGHHYTLGCLPPNHYRLTNLSMLQAGAAGWNWYMLVNRDNWYMCPINEWGRKRNELFPVFAGIVQLFRRLAPPDCERLTSTAATFDVEAMSDVKAGWQENPMLESLARADIAYEFFDVETGHRSKPLLFYAGPQHLAAAAQRRLLAFVRAGGALVLFHDRPRTDENFEPCHLLGIPDPDRILENHLVEVELGREKVRVRSPLFIHDRAPGRPIMARRALEPAEVSLEEDMRFEQRMVGTRYRIGFMRRIGRGRIVALGVKPSPELLPALHRWLGVDVPARSLVPGVSCALLRRGRRLFAVVVNNGDEDKIAGVLLSRRALGRRGRAWNLETGEAVTLAAGTLGVRVPRKDGVVIEIG